MAKVAVISKNVKDQVAHLIVVQDEDFMKNAKAFTKAVNRERKFNRFINGDDSTGLKAITDNDLREKILKELSIITDIPGKQAAVIKMLQTEVDDIVASKIADVTKGMILNEKEKALLAERALKFRRFVSGQLMTGLREYGKELGVIEYVDEQVAQPAAPQAV